MSEISGDTAKHEITAMHYCYALLLCILLCNKKAMLN